MGATALACAPCDWDSGGGGAADVVAALLRALGCGDVFVCPPSAHLCAEPIVVACGAWARDSRQADGSERGVRHVEVLACREDPRAAEAVACALERSVRTASWAGLGTGWHMRVVAADTEAPTPRGRDGSGRWVWGFTVRLTIARYFDG